ncbi:MAG: nickel pincer cofactor biosynthesis protein LarB [bacterium]
MSSTRGGGDQKGVEHLGFARIDTARRERCGRPEVIFGEGKAVDELVRIADAIYAREGYVLATRVSPELARELRSLLPDAVYHVRARCLTLGNAPEVRPAPPVGILCAGTSDLAVAEEAAVTLESFGRVVERIHDVGVAGLHRLLGEMDQLRSCGVLIVVAGMEGALPSVVAGLVDLPVIAVPTSIGYGASFGGLAALLGMLNSCANGVTVTNIDNGFGAACAADAILRLTERKPQ